MISNASINFVFFGTDEVSIGVLDALKSGGLLPSLIITRTDQPTGRKQILTSPPVKIWADQHSIPTLQPEKFKEIENWSEKIAGAELAVVASFGKIIPRWILDSFPKGVLNVHPSLLPKYRGPTPFQSALLAGEKETGVTIMVMDEEMDHGDIVASTKFEIQNSKNYTELGNELSRIGGEMLVEIIPKWIRGEISPMPQNHDEVTYTKKFTNEDSFIQPETLFGRSATKEIEYAERQVRALNPEPGTWTEFEVEGRRLKGEGKIRIKILSAKIEDGKLVPIRVIPAGKKEMSWEDFKRGQDL